MICWLRRWWKRQLARSMHAYLVAEARSDWRVETTHRMGAVNKYGEECGFWVFVAQENMLGERRVLITNRPTPPYPKVPTCEIWAQLKQWEACGRRKTIPFKEVA